MESIQQLVAGEDVRSATKIHDFVNVSYNRHPSGGVTMELQGDNESLPFAQVVFAWDGEPDRHTALVVLKDLYDCMEANRRGYGARKKVLAPGAWDTYEIVANGHPVAGFNRKNLSIFGI
jgi:hypothetical protein